MISRRIGLWLAGIAAAGFIIWFANDVAPDPGISIEQGDGHIFAILEADFPWKNATPSLILVCEDGRPRSVWVDLAVPPPKPPPLRGQFGEFSAGALDLREEMSWGPDTIWMVRDVHPELSRAVYRALINGEALTFRPPQIYRSWAPVTWRKGPKTHRVQLIAACGP